MSTVASRRFLFLVLIVLAVTSSACATSSQFALPGWAAWIRDAPGKLIRAGGSWQALRYVILAFFVGILGAWAFYFGVFVGFISRDSRTQLLEFLIDGPNLANRWRRFRFCILGGVVAGVFQWAQPGSFAPIQAFVLGATWPSVVTNIMSGGQGSTGKMSAADAPPDKIPAPSSGKTAADAQVIIP